MSNDEPDVRLQKLAGGARKGREKACPSAEEWAALAAGLVETGRRDSLLDHASRCDSCGALLHALVEDFSGDVSEAEQQSLDALESPSPEWQRKMSTQMAEAASRDRIIPMRIRPWLAKAAMIALVAASGWLAWNRWMARDPESLLAQAYTQQRPFEFRIPRAEQAPVRVKRGAAGAPFNRPPALIEADSEIAGGLENDSSNVRWLQLRARSELLAGDPDKAITALDRALSQKPGDADLLAEMGVAYALRAERQNQSADYAQSEQFLVRSLDAKPNRVEAVFNLALVYQRMNRFAEAEREWRRYLELDRGGTWRREAQNHLTEVQQKNPSRPQEPR